MKILCFSLLFFSGFLHAQDSLTIYNLPSPRGIDWTSPKNLFTSMIKNRWKKNHRFMGHVFVGLNCDGNEELTGMSVERFDYLSQLFFENRGFGILYHSFKGKLEEKNQISSELEKYLEEGSVSFVKFLLSKTNCQRLLTYLKEFKSYNVGNNYGLVHRPLYGEGSGCSAFGVSFLEVADILDQEFKDEWLNYINIPYELAGPPLRDEGVSPFKILFSNLNWAKENEQHFKLTFWDPDKMNQWVVKRIKAPSSEMKIITEKKAQGIQFDKTLWPTPAKPIWKKDKI